MDLEKIHRACKEIFDASLMQKNSGRSNACQIWDVLTERISGCDNCIGENFNQMIRAMRLEWFNHFKPSSESDHPEFYIETYIIRLYLFLERMEFLFNEIDPDQSFALVQNYRNELKTMNIIRLWANFIKHPKEFVYVHWPIYIIEGEKYSKSDETILVSTSFLKDHYSSEKNIRPEHLKNKDTVVVQFPKIEELTKGFCKDLNSFF